jgi:uncharacterized membrane protein
MKIFPIMVLIGLCAMITLASYFSFAIFGSVSSESGNATYTNETIAYHEQINGWSVIGSALGIVTVLILAFKLFKDTATE